MKSLNMYQVCLCKILLHLGFPYDNSFFSHHCSSKKSKSKSFLKNNLTFQDTKIFSQFSIGLIKLVMQIHIYLCLCQSSYYHKTQKHITGTEICTAVTNTIVNLYSIIHFPHDVVYFLLLYLYSNILISQQQK